MELNEKIVVITGASSGIGAALAEVVSKKGGIPVLVARRREELEKIAEKCLKNSLVIQADCTNRSEVQNVMSQTLSKFGRVDVWVNNVGRGITALPLTLTDEDFDEMMKVNVKSALYGMQTVIPHFLERGTGIVINVSSTIGRLPFIPIRAAYAASKHALNALTVATRMEVKSKSSNVHVCLVSPGLVYTDFGNNAVHGGFDSKSLPDGQTAEEVAEIISNVMIHPKDDVYTRSDTLNLVSKYYSSEDMSQFEISRSIPPQQPKH